MLRGADAQPALGADDTVALVERARRGDHDAFVLVTRERAYRLHRVAIRVLGDRGAAEDAVQETLYQAWKGVRGVRDATRFDAWLYRLLIRACQRERSRRRRIVEVHVPEARADPPASDDVSRHIADRDALERAFRRLTLEHRTIIVLRFFEDRALDEIVELLGIPIGTVKSRLYHALRQLRASVEADSRRPSAGAAR